MPNIDDSNEIARLQELNEELSESLERCHALLDDCRTKLATASNDNSASDVSNETAQDKRDGARLE